MDEKRNNVKGVIVVFALFAMLALAGCGGGIASLADDLGLAPDITAGDVQDYLDSVNGDTTGTTTPVTTETGSDSSTDTTGTIPAITEDTLGDVRFLPLGTPLPRFPSDSRGSSAVKVTSEVIDYSGTDFLTAAGATVNGDTLVLQSSADEIAWAMFQIGGLADRDVTTFAILTVPQDPETYYRVGVSNYDTALWDFVITSSLPEVQADLTENRDQLISALGNLYYVVAVSGGKSVRVRSGHIITSDSGEWGDQWGADDEWGTPDPDEYTDDGDEWDEDYYDDWYDDWCDDWDGDDCYGEDYLYGTIDDFGTDYIVIDGEEFAMDPDVFVMLWDDTEGGSELLQAGMYAEIWKEEAGDGEWVVIEVYEVPEDWNDEYWDDDGYGDDYGDGYDDDYGDDYDWDDEDWDDEGDYEEGEGGGYYD